MVKSSDTGGVKPMNIAGRYVRERERLLGMTDAERGFRAQWLKDQQLTANEPRHVPELYNERFNPFRRFYRAPLDAMQKALEPVLGEHRALTIRYFSGKILMGIAFAYGFTYYMKYNANDWTRKGGWYKTESRVAVLEGDPGYPKVSDRHVGSDYASRGFNQVKLNL